MRCSSQALLALALLVSTGCQIQDSAPLTDQGAGQAAAISAEGWDKVVIQDVVRLVLTVNLKSSGHYDTNKNACSGMPGQGALDVADWNPVARTLNAAATQPMRAEQYCVPITHSPTGLDGTVTLVNGNSKVEIFKIQYGPSGKEACTKIGDREVAQTLVNTLNRIALIAAFEGCANRPEIP